MSMQPGDLVAWLEDLGCQYLIVDVERAPGARGEPMGWATLLHLGGRFRKVSYKVLEAQYKVISEAR